MIRCLLTALLLIWLSADVHSEQITDIDVEDAERHGVSIDFHKKWHAIALQANQSPQQALKDFTQQQKQHQPTTEKEALYLDLIHISLLNYNSKFEESLKLIERLFASTLNRAERIYHIRLLTTKAFALQNTNQMKQAQSTIEQAILLSSEAGFKDEVINSKILQAQILVELGEFKRALNDMLKVYEDAKVKQDKQLLSAVLTTIATIYDISGEPVKAVQYHKESLEYLNMDTDHFEAAIIYYNIAYAYNEAKDYSLSQEYSQKALSISKRLDDKTGIAYAHNLIGQSKLKTEQLEQAEQHYIKAHDLFVELDDHRMKVESKAKLALIYSKLSRFELADQYIKESKQLFALSPVKGYEIIIKTIQAELLENKGDFKASLAVYKEYLKLVEDSIKNEKENSLSELKVKFDTDVKEAKNAILEKENALNQIRLEQQADKQNILWLIIAFSFVVTFCVIYILNKQIKVRQRFKLLALTDELTGAPNRRNILEYARKQLKSAKETNNSFVLAIIDLDFFKRINDSYGHDIGDKVLIKFFKNAKNTLRSVDRIGRYGGEEWLVVLPGQTVEQVSFVFQRIKKSVAESAIKGLPTEHNVTFSMGAAEFKPDQDSLEKLLRLADDALYQAKENGRNQLVA